MKDDALQTELADANANRAVLYYLIFVEVRNALGQDRAIEIMKRAIYQRGTETSPPIKQFAPDRIRELGEYHVRHSAGGGKVFNPEIQRLDHTAFEVLNTTCLLKQAWIDYGRTDTEVALMCDIGSAIDYGKFEGAGFTFEVDTWKAGKRDCCALKAYAATRSEDNP